MIGRSLSCSLKDHLLSRTCSSGSGQGRWRPHVTGGSRDVSADANMNRYSSLRSTCRQVLRQGRNSKSCKRDAKRIIRWSRLSAHLPSFKKQHYKPAAGQARGTTQFMPVLLQLPAACPSTYEHPLMSSENSVLVVSRAAAGNRARGSAARVLQRAS